MELAKAKKQKRTCHFDSHWITEFKVIRNSRKGTYKYIITKK